MNTRLDHLDLLRSARHAAADRRKLFLALYGLLLFLPLALLVLACGRTALHGDLAGEISETFVRPVQATGEFFKTAFHDGRGLLMALVLLGIWLVGRLMHSFFGLAVMRMLAVEITSGRRAEVKEAIRFARGHWFWGFITPASLLFASLLMLGFAVFLVWLAMTISELFLVLASPAALVLVLGAAFMLVGLWGGGILAGPTVATEWSDAFDAITRVYGYGFTHTYRLFLYRTAGRLVLLGAAVARALRAGLVFLLLYGVLLLGLGTDGARELIDATLLEQPQGVGEDPSAAAEAHPLRALPQTAASWTLLFCAAAYVTAVFARLLVFRLALCQVTYLLLRRHIDKVPLDNIDGYRPDDSAYDPTAQGFELVEVEEEISAE